jgi:hypothetical protein
MPAHGICKTRVTLTRFSVPLIPNTLSAHSLSQQPAPDQEYEVVHQGRRSVTLVNSPLLIAADASGTTPDGMLVTPHSTFATPTSV